MARHDIPDDGAPHAATSECGCGPSVRRDGRPGEYGGRVYVHVDQRPGQRDDEQEGPADDLQ